MNLFEELSDSLGQNSFDSGCRAGRYAMLSSNNPHKDDHSKADEWEAGRKSTFPTEYLTKPCNS